MNDPSRSRLQKAIRVFKSLYPHLTLIFSIMFTVFWILDRFNPMMGFISGSMSKTLMIFFFGLVLVGSVIYVFTDAYGFGSGNDRRNGSDNEEKK